MTCFHLYLFLFKTMYCGLKSNKNFNAACKISATKKKTRAICPNCVGNCLFSTPTYTL